MASNILEFIQDEWHSDYNGAPSNESGLCSGGCLINASDSRYNTSATTFRVTRGGGMVPDSSNISATKRSVTS